MNMPTLLGLCVIVAHAVNKSIVLDKKIPQVGTLRDYEVLGMI